jgi:hypothetical protein
MKEQALRVRKEGTSSSSSSSSTSTTTCTTTGQQSWWPQMPKRRVTHHCRKSKPINESVPLDISKAQDGKSRQPPRVLERGRLHPFLHDVRPDLFSQSIKPRFLVERSKGLVCVEILHDARDAAFLR